MSPFALNPPGGGIPSPAATGSVQGFGLPSPTGGGPPGGNPLMSGGGVGSTGPMKNQLSLEPWFHGPISRLDNTYYITIRIHTHKKICIEAI